MSSGPVRPPEEALLGLPQDLFEAFLRRAHELAKVGTYLVDLTSRKGLVSPEMASLLRLGDRWTEVSLDEFRSRFLLPEDAEAVQAQAERAYVAGGKLILEGRLVRADGEIIWGRASASVERNERGDPIVVGVMQDVSESALQASVRTALNNCIHELPADATPEQSAQVVCDALRAIPRVDFAAVFEFCGSDQTTVLAHRAPQDFPAEPSGPGFRAREVRELALRGARAVYWTPAPDDGVWGQAMTTIGLKAMAVGPIVHGDHVDGAIVLGTCDPAFARTIVERLPAVVDLSSTPSALLAARLHEHREQTETRAALLDVIARRAFWPVFQPVVDLATSEPAGFEALVRFASERPPDRCFADAHRVGVGVALELAVLHEALDAGRQLPAGRPLHVNVSPAVLADRSWPRDVLARANRPIVLEITEHQVITDYAAFRHAIRALGRNVRVAVDDAGAGVANFAHIVELQPDLVKLDIGLVRGVNVDVGRQALVTAMRQFARATGCHLVAEGIETSDEAATLRNLGVAFGQGDLFGKPARVESWA